MGVSRYLSRRGAAIALSAGILLSALGAVGPVQAGSGTTDHAKAAAGYVAAQVEAGGLSASVLADAIFALAGSHVGGTAVAGALTQLAGKVDAFAGYGGTLKPGPLSKVMLAVKVAGGDPTSFNGHDLETDLRGLLITSGADTGRFSTAYINDQSFAVLALSTTSGGAPASAVDYLSGKECTAGDYSWDGSCPVAAGTEDPDTTATALMALQASGSTAAADKATQWLLDQQAQNGSFAGYGTTNTGSTGLAAEALRAAGKTAEADAASAWILAVQYGCRVTAANRGAIPWTASDAGFSLVDATAQAVLAFGAARLDLLTIAGATAGAPKLQCAAATPRPTSTGVAIPTEPPTDGLAAPTGSGASSSGTLLLTATLMAVCGALIAFRRSGNRR